MLRHLLVLSAALAIACGSQDAPGTEQPDTDVTVDAGGTGGATGTGGKTGAGGTKATGGASGVGGAQATGGSTAAGGSAGTGGKIVRDAAPRDAAISPGVWRDITPAQVGTKYPCTDLKFDPQAPDTLYAYFGDGGGVWKSTDAGATWAQIGDLPMPNSLGRLWVDPTDSLHLYAAGSVRGSSNGFWVSHDAGNTWTMPAAFKTGASSTWNYDVYNIAVDPTDFNHVLLGFHTGWSGGDDSGIVESTDGGVTYVAHQPMAGMNHAQGVAFLYNPALGLGDKNTWLVGGGYSAGVYRTTNAGSSWTKVSTMQEDHGGFDAQYSTQGFLYIGATGGIGRSTDNGLTWTLETSGVPYGYYYGVIGDNKRLYTRQAFVGVAYTSPFIVSDEGGANEGKTWTTYGTQTIPEGPWRMVFDPLNRVIYNATWGSGAWVLTVEP
jgi:hypothetical protein